MKLRVPARALAWLAAALVASAAAAQPSAPPAADAPPPAAVPPAAPVEPIAAPAGDTDQPPAQPEPEPKPEPEPTPPATPPPVAPPAAPSPTAVDTAARAASATGTERPITEEEEEWKRGAPAWRAMLTWGQSYTAAGVAPSAYPTFNPTYAWSFLLALGYDFDEANALSLTQIAALELTDSETTNTRQEFLLLDTLAEYAHKFDVALDGDQSLALIGGAGVVLPTSKSSRAATMILGTRARVSGGYTNEHVLHGLDAMLTFSLLHRFTSANTVSAEAPYPCNRLADASAACSFLGGSTNVRDLLMLGLDGHLKMTDELYLGAQLSFFFGRAIGLGDTFETMIDTGVVQIDDNSTTHWRNTRWLIFSLGYTFTDWFSAEARVTNIFSERSPDGSLRAPFNPLDTLLGLDLTVSFDQLYMNARGHGGT
jgi:hypothetical protein